MVDEGGKRIRLFPKRLVFAKEKAEAEKQSYQSYFVDEIHRGGPSDLQEKKGYTKQSPSSFCIPADFPSTRPSICPSSPSWDKVYKNPENFPTLKRRRAARIRHGHYDPIPENSCHGRRPREKTAERVLNQGDPEQAPAGVFD
jgi:hypothetical protein